MEMLLSDIIEGWPAELGDTLADLANLGVDELKRVLADHDPAYGSLVWGLRGQAQQLIRSSEREHALSTPAQVERMLRDGLLRPRPNWWIIYPLDNKLRRIAAPHKTGGSRFKVDLRPKFPTPDEGHTTRKDGSHLVIWGGTPDVLEIPGVADRIRIFATARPLSDVAFWDPETKTVWSLRFGVGQSPNGPVHFDETAHHEHARSAPWH